MTQEALSGSFYCRSIVLGSEKILHVGIRIREGSYFYEPNMQ
jgi:hypothetical protein